MSRADDESDDEKQKTKNNLVGEEENPDLENEENHQKSNSFGKGPSGCVRTFDGLSVIDEQTEETQTTTESPIVYGGPSSSRGNSGSRNYLPGLYDDDDVEDATCGMTHLEEGYGPGIYNNPLKSPVKKKGSCLYEDNVSPYAPGGGNWNANCENFESRPASPYPYNGIHHHRDSYQKRFQVLQNLSMAQSSPNNHPLCDNEWIFTTNSQPPSEDLHNYVDGKSDAPPIKSNSLYHPSSSSTTTVNRSHIQNQSNLISLMIIHTHIQLVQINSISVSVYLQNFPSTIFIQNILFHKTIEQTIQSIQRNDYRIITRTHKYR